MTAAAVARTDTVRGDMLRGFRAVAPLLPGVIPFAMVTGAAAAESGLPLAHSLTISWAVFAGASQLTMLALLEHDAPVLIVMVTALVVNLRFMMYSAALSPHFKALPRGRKALLSYLLTDQAYLLSLPELAGADKTRGIRFYMGVAATLWVIWQTGCTLGVLLGHGLPPHWRLEFAVPLSFLALLVPALKTRPALAAAAVSGVSMLWTHRAPAHLGMIIACLLGVLTGVVLERRRT